MAGGRKFNSTERWGQAFKQVMHKTQSRLSSSWAGWEYKGQPSVAIPSPFCGPPL